MSGSDPARGPVLGFDTSAAHCAAAIVLGDRILAQTVEAMARGQAERLMPMLVELLRDAGLAWRDLAAIGVGTGPGNFTGTRIAVAAARGMALGLGVPAVGVPAADALSHGLGAVTIALPAPRGGVTLIQGGRTETRDAGLALPDGWPRRVAGPAADRVAGAEIVAASPLAPGIARLAAARARPGGPRPAPIYLRPPDAAPPSDPPPTILPDPPA